MSGTTSLMLGDQLSTFIEQQVRQGRYDSASEVVRAGLLLLKERETKIEALRAALVKGENSGASAPFDFDGFVERARGA